LEETHTSKALRDKLVQRIFGNGRPPELPEELLQDASAGHSTKRRNVHSHLPIPSFPNLPSPTTSSKKGDLPLHIFRAKLWTQIEGMRVNHAILN